MSLNDSVTTKHPSFGLLQFSRVSSSKKQSLFGSSIEHTHTIRMTVSRAENQRNQLHSDHVFARETLLELEMSPVQFSDMITSMNIGQGVPVTLLWTEKDRQMPSCPHVTKRAQFENEFKQIVLEATKTMEKMETECIELLAKPSLLKSDREKIKQLLFEVTRRFRDYIPFVMSQWNEQMDKTAGEAKAEVEAFFRGIVEQVGAEHLLEKLEALVPTLENSKG